MTAPRALFFYGTLRHTPLLEVVVGRVPEMRPARLPDHRTRVIAGEAHPSLEASPGDTAEGIVLSDLTDEEWSRIDFYEGPDDYRRTTRMVETDDGPLEAQVYFALERHELGGPWTLEAWVRDYGPVMVETAHEAMAVREHLTDREFDAAYPTMISRAQARLRARAEPAPAAVRGGFRREDITVSEERRPYTKYFAVAEQDLRFPRFTGGLSEPVTRAAFIGGDAVTVLPYDPARDRVLLIEQFRFGPHMRHDPRPWLLEPIAGRIDLGETPQETARREAVEEARLTIGALHEIGRYYPSPGTLAEFLISYIGIADLPDDAAVIAGEETEAEDIKGHLIPFETLMDLVATGEAANAPLIMSAQWIAMNRERLRGHA